MRVDVDVIGVRPDPQLRRRPGGPEHRLEPERQQQQRQVVRAFEQGRHGPRRGVVGGVGRDDGSLSSVERGLGGLLEQPPLLEGVPLHLGLGCLLGTGERKAFEEGQPALELVDPGLVVVQGATGGLEDVCGMGAGEAQAGELVHLSARRARGRG